MGKRIAPKKRSKSGATHRVATSRASEKPALLDERFRLTPETIRLTEDDDGVHVPTKIQLFRTGTFKKEMADGKSVRIPITTEVLEEMVANWKAKIRGTDIALDFAHRSDEEAAGWFKNVYIQHAGHETQLWAEILWTPDGRAAVAGKKFRYISPDFAFSWKDNETGEKYGPTLFGAGLTNRPVIKNMAPTVELTEVKDMAKKLAKKKISELTTEELELRLAEEKDEEKRELLQLRLDEMSDADPEEDDEDDAGDEDDSPEARKKKASNMGLEELRAAYVKQCDEMAELSSKMSETHRDITKTLAELRQEKKEAQFTTLFTTLLAEGKVVPAQKKAFMAGDMEKLFQLAEKPKFSTVGNQGKGATETQKTSAQDKVIKLADELLKKDKSVKHADAVKLVLSENPELNREYEAEMEGAEAEAV
jgi:hypothetical protein